mgnify:CR=1 FL=1
MTRLKFVALSGFILLSACATTSSMSPNRAFEVPVSEEYYLMLTHQAPAQAAQTDAMSQ